MEDAQLFDIDGRRCGYGLVLLTTTAQAGVPVVPREHRRSLRMPVGRETTTDILRERVASRWSFTRIGCRSVSSERLDPPEVVGDPSLPFCEVVHPPERLLEQIDDLLVRWPFRISQTPPPSTLDRSPPAGALSVQEIGNQEVQIRRLAGAAP